MTKTCSFTLLKCSGFFFKWYLRFQQAISQRLFQSLLKHLWFFLSFESSCKHGQQCFKGGGGTLSLLDFGLSPLMASCWIRGLLILAVFLLLLSSLFGCFEKLDFIGIWCCSSSAFWSQHGGSIKCICKSPFAVQFKLESMCWGMPVYVLLCLSQIFD